MAAIQSGGGGTGGSGGSGGGGGSLNRERIIADIPDQVNGKFTLAWDLEKKTKYGNFPDFAVWQGDQKETVPIVTKRDGGGIVTGYEFDLSNIKTEIYII